MRSHERDVAGVNGRPIVMDTGQATAVFTASNAAVMTISHKLGRPPTHVGITEIGNFGPLGLNWTNGTDRQVTLTLISPTAITLSFPISWVVFS